MYETGTEIYYTGDVANHDGFGVITEVTPASDYSPVGYWITLYGQHGQYCTCGLDDDEGHCIPAHRLHAYESNFGPGNRFMLRSEYDKDRAEKLAAMREEYMGRQAS